MNMIPADNSASSLLYDEVNFVIDTEVRPYIERDGGRIMLKAVENGIVYVELSGACHGCSASDFTMRAGVERILRRKIPAVISAKLWK
ncbi:MAG: NifU family protein [Ignavibacteriae bacterium]|nr:NifU family protein [Ignavibacteriota bacterium]